MYIPRLLNSEHQVLRDSLRQFLNHIDATGAAREAVDGGKEFNPQAWDRMSADLGLQAMLVAEEYDGFGAGAEEVAIVLHELGRVLLPSPFLSSAVIGATLLGQVTDTEDVGDLLSQISTGAAIATVATHDPLGHVKPIPIEEISETNGGPSAVLDGERWYVSDGVAATHLLIPVVHPAGMSVAVVETADPRVEVRSMEVLDPTRPQSIVRLNQVQTRVLLPSGGADTALSRAQRMGLLAVVADQAGGAERLVEMTIEYARVRHQFERPIGAFQAVKHTIAEMVFDLERMLAVVDKAAEMVASEPDSISTQSLLHLAKVFCSEAYSEIASNCVHIHGGIGFTWEHDAHMYFRRARSTSSILGSPAQHRELLLASLGL